MKFTVFYVVFRNLQLNFIDNMVKNHDACNDAATVEIITTIGGDNLVLLRRYRRN